MGRLAARWLLALVLAQAAPGLRLEASTTRSEYTAGDRFTITAHLFNDGDTDTIGSISVSAPPGFDLLSYQSAAGAIPKGGALGASFSYRVAPTTPRGLARFVVTATGGLTQIVTIRVGPMISPPPPLAYRQYFPAFR